jgi:hypothetical protein
MTFPTNGGREKRTHNASKEIAMEVDSDKQKYNGKRHDRAFKEAAAKLVTEQGYTPGRAASSRG